MPAPELVVRNPATGAEISRWPLATAQEVQAQVEQARVAAEQWRALGFAQRRRRLSAWRAQIARDQSELAQLVHDESGKPVPDAQLEIVVALGHLAWAGAHARKVLRPRRVRSGLLAINHSSYLWYEPMGVVGVIGPWNYPVLTPMGSLAYALAAGNAVVYKPSEYTPGVGVWLRDAWVRANPDLKDVLQVAIGDGTTGAALCSAGVDLVGFTGSTATGRAVLRTCAETLTPVILECGGKDAMIVDADADLAAAADAAVWAGLSNAGQTCLGVERIYVHQDRYEDFVHEVRSRMDRLAVGAGVDSVYGPMTTPGQAAIVQDHIAAARRDGAQVVASDADLQPWLPPTLLLQVPEHSRAVQEETFGPTLVVNSVPTLQAAIDQANSTGFGLGSAVYTRRKKRGLAVARQLRTGMVSINGVLAFASVGELPLGGVGESGFGRIHGADGLRALSRPKAVTRERFGLPVQLTSFDRPAFVVPWVARILGRWHARG